MRVYAALAALLIGLGVPVTAMAGDKITSFEERWPEAPMRKPTLPELVHLVSGAIKRDIKPVIDAKRARRRISRACGDEICQLLDSR
jgi:hypothetical protein